MLRDGVYVISSGCRVWSPPVFTYFDTSSVYSILLVRGYSALEVLKRALAGSYPFDVGQKVARFWGDGYRCPTREDALTIHRACKEYAIPDLLERFEGSSLAGLCWGCESDSDVLGFTYDLSTGADVLSIKTDFRSVRPVRLVSSRHLDTWDFYRCDFRSEFIEFLKSSDVYLGICKEFPDLCPDASTIYNRLEMWESLNYVHGLQCMTSSPIWYSVLDTHYTSLYDAWVDVLSSDVVVRARSSEVKMK